MFIVFRFNIVFRLNTDGLILIESPYWSPNTQSIGIRFIVEIICGVGNKKL